jgi:hypothetical protein
MLTFSDIKMAKREFSVKKKTEKKLIEIKPS